MSKVRAVAFPVVEAETEEPSWLASGGEPILPPPFLRGHAPAAPEPLDLRGAPTLPSERPPAPPPAHESIRPSLPRPSGISVRPEPRPPSVAPPRVPSMPPPRPPTIHPPAARLSEVARALSPSPEQQEFAHAAIELAATRPRILSHVEEELLRLSVRIAEAIIGREVALDPALHLALARSAVLALGDASQAVLRASPRSYDAIVAVQGSPSVEVDGTRIDVVRDPDLDGLGCVAEGQHGQVDGRVEERLATLLRAFVSASHRRAEGTP